MDLFIVIVNHKWIKRIEMLQECLVWYIQNVFIWYIQNLDVKLWFIIRVTYINIVGKKFKST